MSFPGIGNRKSFSKFPVAIQNPLKPFEINLTTRVKLFSDENTLYRHNAIHQHVKNNWASANTSRMKAFNAVEPEIKAFHTP